MTEFSLTMDLCLDVCYNAPMELFKRPWRHLKTADEPLPKEYWCRLTEPCAVCRERWRREPVDYKRRTDPAYVSQR